MLIKRAVLDGIVAGTIDVQFRRWRRPSVKAGGKLRTVVGELAVGGVDAITAKQITARDAKRAGYPSRAELLRDLDSYRDDGQLYRIEVRLAGPDPRVELRERDEHHRRRDHRAATQVGALRHREQARAVDHGDTGPHRASIPRPWPPTSPRASAASGSRSRTTCES